MRFLISSSLLFLLTGKVYPQGTIEDYKRAYSVKETYSAKQVLYSDVTPVWIPDTHIFWYVRHTEKGREYVKVNADKSLRTPLFDHHALAGLLNEKCGNKQDAYGLFLNKLAVDKSLSFLTFELKNKRWSFDIAKNMLTEVGDVEKPLPKPHWMVVDDEKGGRPVQSPDGEYIAYH